MAEKAVKGAAVGVTNRLMPIVVWKASIAVVLLVSASFNTYSATLPPDTVDVMHHQYDGGGMKISGPSVLVRKGVGSQVSLSAHYYVDTVSAASVDVLATASAYEEERTELSGGVDYLVDKAILSAGYTNSSENDYEANTAYLSVTQDFFGDLTTLSLAYARGWDEIGQRGLAKNQWEDKELNSYKIGLTQVVTKEAVLGLNIDVISDEGKLENPYRKNRYLDAASAEGYSYQDELYPDTRTSTAVGLRGAYYLPYRASIALDYRYFVDSWDIRAHTYMASYSHAFREHWIFETRVRFYQQGQAEFYSDLFPFSDSQTHVARDKELSKFSGMTYGLGLSYQLQQGAVPLIDRLQFSLLVDYLNYDYDNFRDVTASGYQAGNEPLYELEAWVTRTSLIAEF